MANIPRKFYKMLFRVKTRQKLPRIPRMYANEFDRKDITLDDARVFARVGARSPEGVKMVMRALRLKTVDQLVALLPHRHYKPKVGERFRRWIQHVLGLTDYEPVVRPAMRRLKEEGLMPGEVDPVLKLRLNRALKEHARESVD